MTRKFISGALALLLLSGCDVPPPAPVVASFNEASVEIQQDNLFGNANANDLAVLAEADRICATGGRRAEYASTRYINTRYTSTATHLFLCLRR